MLLVIDSTRNMISRVLRTRLVIFIYLVFRISEVLLWWRFDNRPRFPAGFPAGFHGIPSGDKK